MRSVVLQEICLSIKILLFARCTAAQCAKSIRISLAAKNAHELLLLLLLLSSRAADGVYCNIGTV